MWTKCLPRDTIQPMESTLRNSNEIICKHRNLRLQVPGKVGAECGLIVRSNSWENFTHYYLFTCCIIVNVIVWEIGRGKQAAGQSRAPGRVMWTKCLPRDTIQPMESTLRNSNEIICKHRNLRLQVPGKVGAECGLIVTCQKFIVTRYIK